ncbi:putative ribonuclease H-like domain-containing protein, partial [Tanacetum coccineum]
MNQFCEMKGIKREFSVVRTPQQNGAEAVNIDCYVQNRVLVIKPHNKTPYELFPGRKPALSFMRPFRCLVKILNTIDHLGSGPNWLFDIDALIKSMNYKPVVASNQCNGNACTKACDDAGEEEKKDAKDPGNKDYEVPSTKEPRVNQEKENDVNSTNNLNTISSTVNAATLEDNVVDENIVYGCADDPNMPNLEEIVYSDDDEDNDAEAHMNNLNTFMPVSPILTTRLHKDHPLEQIIRDTHSAPQTRKITKSMTKHAQEGNLSIKRSNLDRSYARRASAVQVTTGLDLGRFTTWQKSHCSFLYGKIEEEVYVCQPPGFEDPNFPDKVYKVEKALYGLYQAPKA